MHTFKQSFASLVKLLVSTYVSWTVWCALLWMTVFHFCVAVFVNLSHTYYISC